MKRIAIIEDGYVRDAQIFSENPDIIEKEPDWEDKFVDVKYPSLYIGIYEGTDENEIRNIAAEGQGVHPDIISLVPLEQETDGNIVEVYVCPVCENGEHSADAKFCKICGSEIQRGELPEADNSEFEKLAAHIGHNIEIAVYGNRNVSIECADCYEVLYSVDRRKMKKEHDKSNETTVINKVFYKGSDIPLTPVQLAKEAGSNFTPADFPARISGSGHCRCPNGGEFELLPKDDPAVIESGGKRYMQCRICECWSHL